MKRRKYAYLRQPRRLHIGEEQDVADDEEREDAEDGEGVEHPHAVVVLRPGEPRLLASVNKGLRVGSRSG